MNTITNIWTVIHKNKYKQEYFPQTKPKINVPLDIKAIQVRKNNAYMCHSMQFIQI